MSKYIELGDAYAALRSEIDTWVSRLGATDFAGAVVGKAAREALQAQKPTISSNWRVSSHLTFCEPFIASANQIQAATARLADVFTIREEPATFSGKIAGGRLVIRGHRLYFETPAACALMAHCYEDTYRKEAWMVATTSEAEAYLELNGKNKPKVSMVHTKSLDSSLATLKRIAKQTFDADLAPEAAPAANTTC